MSEVKGFTALKHGFSFHAFEGRVRRVYEGNRGSKSSRASYSGAAWVTRGVNRRLRVPCLVYGLHFHLPFKTWFDFTVTDPCVHSGVAGWLGHAAGQGRRGGPRNPPWFLHGCAGSAPRSPRVSTPVLPQGLLAGTCVALGGGCELGS